MKTFEIVPVDRELAPAIFLVTGIPGSGKSTVARALADSFATAAGTRCSSTTGPAHCPDRA